MLTGSPYYLDNLYQSAAFERPNNSDLFDSAGIFDIVSQNQNYRWPAWQMQNVERAAFMAPDGSAEAAYYAAQLNSDLEFMEGGLCITSSTLKPSTSQVSFACSGSTGAYNGQTANRWDLGRYTAAHGNNFVSTSGITIIPPNLHKFLQGVCNNGSSQPTTYYTSAVSQLDADWMYDYLAVVGGEAVDAGYSQAKNLTQAVMQHVQGNTLSPAVNPYLNLASYTYPLSSGTISACGGIYGAGLQFYSSYGAVYGGWSSAYGNPTTLTSPNNFASNSTGAGGLPTGNFPESDHAYSLLSRAAGTYMNAYGIAETDTNGTYQPTTAWAWLGSNVPYFNNAAAQADPLDFPSPSTMDFQIKWALSPRSTIGFALTVNSTNPSSGVPITASPADNNGASSGSTSFVLDYTTGTIITLTAPATASGNSFQSWSGCNFTAGFQCIIQVNSNASVTVNYATPPPTATLTIASTNPASGVVISASPADNNSHSSATTPGSLVYNVSTAVTLTAPATASGNNFNNWTGCTSSSGLTCNVTVSTNATITANYTPAPTTAVLTVASSNPASGVTITNSPADNSSLTSVSTPGTLTFNINTAVTLTAPAAASGNNFANWTGCDLTNGTQCNVTMTANRTVTANYSTPPPTVTVNIHSTNPSTSVSVATSPADNNGLTSCTTTCAFVYNAGASFTLTAPASVGANSFSSWSGCPSPASNVCSIASATATSITANYASPPTIVLTVDSQNPASGVTIAVSPSDNSGHSSVSTPGTLTYNANTAVTATAPGTAGGNNFSAWLGCNASSNPCGITPAANATITAVYVTPPATATITVTSSGASSVSMSNQPADNNSVISGSTTFTLLYNVGTNIQISAPPTGPGSTVFRSWSGCTTTSGTTCNLTVAGNATVTANYSAAPPAPTGLTISGWIGALMALLGGTQQLGRARQ